VETVELDEPNEHVERCNLFVVSGLEPMTIDGIPQSVKEVLHTLIFAILWISMNLIPIFRIFL